LQQPLKALAASAADDSGLSACLSR
jgi:hypothetical protein